tara:strand:- start:75 stop:539 length:465 start_codon:yes stop_codon:yes gene_type:complete
MKIKFIFLYYIIFFLLNSCGYERIYLLKELNYNISEIEFQSNENVDKSIKKAFQNLNFKKGGKNINVVINSQKKTNIITKDKKGNPDLLELLIIVELFLYDETELLNNKIFLKSSKYSNSDNKFDLNIYEKNLEKSLNEKTTEEIINYLTQLRV